MKNKGKFLLVLSMIVMLTAGTAFSATDPAPRSSPRSRVP